MLRLEAEPLPTRKLSCRLLGALRLPHGMMPSLLTCRSGCTLGLLDDVPRGEAGSCSSSVCLHTHSAARELDVQCRVHPDWQLCPVSTHARRWITDSKHVRQDGATYLQDGARTLRLGLLATRWRRAARPDLMPSKVSSSMMIWPP